MAFELEDFTQIKLASINVRSEKHGPDHLEPAVDLAIELNAPNTILSVFDGHLLSSLYHRSEAAGSGQQQLDGVEELAALPNLRFPHMGPIKWARELAGYTLTIEHGLGGGERHRAGGLQGQQLQARAQGRRHRASALSRAKRRQPDREDYGQACSAGSKRSAHHADGTRDSQRSAGAGEPVSSQ